MYDLPNSWAPVKNTGTGGKISTTYQLSRSESPGPMKDGDPVRTLDYLPLLSARRECAGEEHRHRRELEWLSEPQISRD